jgi:hypothetical protein
MPDIGSAIGGGISLLGQRSARKSQAAASDAASREAELAYQRSLPWDVKGAFGEAEYDEEGRQLDMSLSQPWQSEYDLAMQGAKDQRGYIAGMEADPYAAGQKFYEQQKALYAPDQEKDRLDLEKRLLGQGMFGSSGGAAQIEALRKAQAQVDLQAQYGGLEKAQGLIDTYRGRAATDLGMAETIGQMPQKYAETGRGIGTGMSSIAGTAAELSGQAAQARGASQANTALGMANQFSGLIQQPNGGGFMGSGYFPTFGTSTTGATTGGMLYGQAPMAGFNLS